MPGAKKPGLMLAIGLGKPKPKSASAEEETKEEDAEDSEAFDSAAEDAFQAIQDGDLEGFKAALKLAMMECMGSDY